MRRYSSFGIGILIESLTAMSSKITDDQIKALRAEAREAGAYHQVNLCDEALDSRGGILSKMALTACETAIRTGWVNFPSRTRWNVFGSIFKPETLDELADNEEGAQFIGAALTREDAMKRAKPGYLIQYGFEGLKEVVT